MRARLGKRGGAAFCIRIARCFRRSTALHRCVCARSFVSGARLRCRARSRSARSLSLRGGELRGNRFELGASHDELLRLERRLRDGARVAFQRFLELRDLRAQRRCALRRSFDFGAQRAELCLRRSHCALGALQLVRRPAARSPRGLELGAHNFERLGLLRAGLPHFAPRLVLELLKRRGVRAGARLLLLREATLAVLNGARRSAPRELVELAHGSALHLEELARVRTLQLRNAGAPLRDLRLRLPLRPLRERRDLTFHFFTQCRLRRSERGGALCRRIALALHAQQVQRGVSSRRRRRRGVRSPQRRQSRLCAREPGAAALLDEEQHCIGLSSSSGASYVGGVRCTCFCRFERRHFLLQLLPLLRL